MSAATPKKMPETANRVMNDANAFAFWPANNGNQYRKEILDSLKEGCVLCAELAKS